MPTLSIHVSEDTAAKVRKIAEKQTNGKISALCAPIIENAIGGIKSIPSAADSDAFTKLVETFH